MGITEKDILKTVAIDVPNMKTQMTSKVNRIEPLLKTSNKEIVGAINEVFDNGGGGSVVVNNDFVYLEDFKIFAETNYDNAFIKAIQEAKISGKHNIKIPSKEILVTKEIVLDCEYLGVFADVNKEQQPKIKMITPNVNIIKVTKSGVSFQNIVIQGCSDYSNNGIVFDTSSQPQNNRYGCDSRIIGCSFIYLKNGIYATGRNVRVFDSLFALCGEAGVHIKKGTLSDDNNNEIRGIVIDRCNFHTMRNNTQDTPCVYIADFSPYASVKITNNYLDGTNCSKLFKGHIQGVIIENNFGNNIGQGVNCIEIFNNLSAINGNPIRSFSIKNNHFVFTECIRVTGGLTNFIYCDGSLRSGDITGNHIQNVNKSFIKCIGNFTNTNVRNNVCLYLIESGSGVTNSYK